MRNTLSSIESHINSLKVIDCLNNFQNTRLLLKNQTKNILHNNFPNQNTAVNNEKVKNNFLQVQK